MESGTLRPTRPLPTLRQVGSIGALLALGAGAWVVTGDRMAGMDAAPGADLGDPGAFAISWLVMMAAMMVPSLIPAGLELARHGERTVAGFVAGYLAAWTAAGLGAYLLVESVGALDVAVLAWDRAGRYVAAGVLLAAAAYQLTAAKGACLDRCRAPLRPARAEHPGVVGGLRDGVHHGAYCVGCCAGLMAGLFALGVMSLTWMVAITALIAAERLLPWRWRTPAVYGVAATLGALAIWMAVAPGDLPGLTLPGSMAGM